MQNCLLWDYKIRNQIQTTGLIEFQNNKVYNCCIWNIWNICLIEALVFHLKIAFAIKRKHNNNNKFLRIFPDIC